METFVEYNEKIISFLPDQVSKARADIVNTLNRAFTLSHDAYIIDQHYCLPLIEGDLRLMGSYLYDDDQAIGKELLKFAIEKRAQDFALSLVRNFKISVTRNDLENAGKNKLYLLEKLILNKLKPFKVSPSFWSNPPEHNFDNCKNEIKLTPFESKIKSESLRDLTILQAHEIEVIVNKNAAEKINRVTKKDLQIGKEDHYTFILSLNELGVLFSEKIYLDVVGQINLLELEKPSTNLFL